MIRFFGKLARGLFLGIDICRRIVLNLFFVVFILAIVWLITSSSPKEVREGTLLDVELTGKIVEAEQSGAQTQFISQLSGEPNELKLRDIIRSLEIASIDPRIEGVVLRVGTLEQIGLVGIREIGAAIDRFRKTGKSVVAWAPSYTQGQYAIASHANTLFIHPMGSVLLKGLSGTNLYWGDTLKSLGVKVNVFKAGAYKSAPELYFSDKPSDANLASQKGYLDEAWRFLTADIEKSRGLMPGAVSRYIESLPEALAKHQGDFSAVLLDANLIDGVKTQEEMKQFLVKTFAPGKNIDDIARVKIEDYLDGFPEKKLLSEPGVITIVAEGTISNVSQLGGIVASRLNATIDAAFKDPNARALVLRLNSPGGDAVAAEMIRSKLETLKKEKKIPIVISMGDAAASGGYWISTAATEIVADPMTVTGSIGVFALFPTLEGLLQKIQVGVGGYKTTWMADYMSPLSTIDPRAQQMIDASIMRTYADFKKLVGQSRNLSSSQVESIAQGRVWLGSQAKSRGLVDRLGGLADAESLAKSLASLTDHAPVIYCEMLPGGWRSMLTSFFKETRKEAFSLLWGPSFAQLFHSAEALEHNRLQWSFATGTPQLMGPVGMYP